MSGRKIVHTYITSILGVVSGLVTNLWIIKELTDRVSADDFGLYSYVFQLSAYLSILQLGLDFSASRSIAEYVSARNYSKASEAFNALKYLNNRLIILASIVSLAIAIYLYLYTDPKTDKSLNIFIPSIACQLILFIQRPFSSILIGNGSQSTVNIINVLRSLLNALISYYFILKGAGIYSILYAELCTVALATLVLYYYSVKTVNWLSTVESGIFSKDIRHEVLKFGIWSSLGGLAWTIEGTSDVLIIKHIVGVQWVAIYVIWWRFPQMMFDLSTRLTTSAFPFFAGYLSMEKRQSQMLFDKVFISVAGLAGLMLVMITSSLPSLIHIWMKGKFGIQDGVLTFTLSIGALVFFRIVGNLLGMYILALGDASVTSKAGWFQTLIKVILGFLMLYWYGIIGLFIASIVASIFQVFFYSMIIVKREYVILYDKLLFTILLFLTASGGILLSRNIYSNWYELILSCALVCIVYIVIVLAIIYFSKFRSFVYELFYGFNRVLLRL